MFATPLDSSYAPIHPEVNTQLQKLMALVGTWKGAGQGEFPNFEPFDYREVLQFRHREGTPYITYEQTATLVDGRGDPIKPSHWEAGVIRPREDGTVIIATAHDSPRVEVLRGEWDTSATLPGMFLLKFESVVHGNDPRMIRATREFFLNGSEFRYTMSMATQRTPDLTGHLKATLVLDAG